MSASLEDKAFVITGATSGIGLAVARALAQRGGSVIGVGRAEDRCRQAQTTVEAVAPDGTRTAYLVADLALQTEVRSLAGRIPDILRDWGRSKLDGLINNAATVPFWQTLTPEGFDLQWAVNHLAPFLLTMELLPLLRAAPTGRVVTVSSGTHYGARLNWEDVQLFRHYSPLRAYGQTKVANILFSAEFNRRFGKGSGVRAFAADPGLVNTELGLKSNSFLARWVWSLRRRGGVSPEQAAEGIAFLAAEPSIQNAREIYWKNSKPKAPSSFAMNPQAARQLWELSAQMCGISS
jgi:NAD(P)-dependent dehydrogenase (short-subunit alcohol dehydrogenase family)